MPKRKMRRWGSITLVLVVVLALLMFGACGGTTTPTAPTTPVEEPATPTGEIPAIPHTLEGRDDCLVCHGEDAFKPFPADHAGRTSDTCTTCHQPAG